MRAREIVKKGKPHPLGYLPTRFKTMAELAESLEAKGYKIVTDGKKSIELANDEQKHTMVVTKRIVKEKGEERIELDPALAGFAPMGSRYFFPWKRFSS